MEDDRYAKIHYLSTVFRSSAQTLFLIRTLLQYSIVCLSIVASIVSVAFQWTFSWVFIIFSWIIQLASLIIKNVAIDKHIHSRDLIKARLLENSLGVKQDQLSYEKLTAYPKHLKNYSASKVDKAYYDSREPLGTKRLAYNLAQSIFYTKKICEENYKKVKLKFFILCGAMLFIIIFSLIYFAIELQIAFIVPITTILAVIIFEEGEQYYRLDRDSAKYGEYDQKMYDYIRHNDFNIEKIMDVLTDYSATTKLSSPIPSGLYGKLKDSLEKDWASRYDSLQTRILNNEKDNAAMPQLFFESAAKEFFSDKTKLEVIIDIILKDTGFDDVEKIDISKILGNSNNDVFSFVLQRRNSIDSIELFVKFYRDSQVFLKEKVALTKYAKKSDYFAKSIICDELEKYSCIVFYHVQSTSVEPFYSVSHIISNVDITKLDYQGKLKNISAAFSTIYKVLNNEKGIDSNAQNVDYLDERKPADLILDLEFFEYEIKGDNTIYLNSCKLTDVAFAEHCFIRQDTFKLEFSNWSTERTTVASTKINGHRIATILPRLNYGKTKINFSRLHGKNFLLSLENYLKIKGICEINISLSEKYENTINAIKSLKPQMVLCHNDFHAENLFVSEKSFKILDLSDVEYALKYTDVCRMQASLLQHFLKLNEGTDIADSFLLILKGKGNDNKIAEFIFQLKSAYDTTVDGNYKEYIYTLLVELILQCFYSICSSRCINEKWSKLLQDIAEMTEQ